MDKRRGETLRKMYGDFTDVRKPSPYPKILQEARKYLTMTNEEAFEREEEIRAYARELLDEQISSGRGKNRYEHVTPSVYIAILGAELYEKIGKGRKALPKLLKIAEINKSGALREHKRLQDFIKRNTKSGEKSIGIEGRVGIFILFLLGGIALSIYSLTATGNAIGNLTGTSQGLLGLILFVFGIAGLVFSKK